MTEKQTVTAAREDAYRLLAACYYPPTEELLESRAKRSQKRYTGFIAQDVEAAARRSDFEFSGVQAPANDRSPYNLSYGEFAAPLVKSVQE